MDDVLYFQKRFYGTLNVPINRINSDALFSLGRATEVTRDELKFSRFISRMRGKFAEIFTKMLETQLVLKQIMTIEDYNNIVADIKFDFSKDNYFTELKDGEINDNRINLARNMQDMVGKYYSHEWVRRNILQQSDDEIEEQDEEIIAENDSGDPRWINPQILQNEQLEQQANMPPVGPDGMPMDGSGQPPASGGTDQQPLTDDDGAAVSAQNDQQTAKMQTAQSTYNLLISKRNRTLADEAKLKSATQILAKNK
jgi:hypothetical protein